MENLNTLSITQPPVQLHQCDRSSIVLACSIDGTFTSATVEFSVMRNGAIETAFTETVTSPVKTGTKSYVVTQDWTAFGTFKWLRVFGYEPQCLFVLLMSFVFFFLSFNFSGSSKGESVAVSIKATVGSKTYTKTKSVVIFKPETCLEFTGVTSGGASSPLSADKTIFSSSSDSFTRSTFTVQRKTGAALSSLDWYLERRKTDGTITSENIGSGSTADT